MIADGTSTVHNVLGGKMLVADYFVNVLGQPALNMGVFVGIISGFVGATAYNKYYNYRKLPDVFHSLMVNASYHCCYLSFSSCWFVHVSCLANHSIRNQWIWYVDCIFTRFSTIF